MLSKFIPYSTQNINNIDKDEVIKALFSSHLTQGEINIRFEKEIANYIGVKHAITCNAATSALYMAFYALKEYIMQGVFTQDCLCDSIFLKKARELKSFSIITTPISFVATSNMMLANGIKPIFADITMDGNLNPNNLESLLREDTVAICTIDYGGNSVDTYAFRDFAQKHKIVWISDSSHSFGASVDNQKVGTHADISIFSFHALKPITTCEGGALVCNNDFFAKIAKLICSHGIEKKNSYNHDCIMLGFNFRLNELSAALGLSQLKRLESFIEKRENIARFYDTYFHNTPYFHTIKIKENVVSSRHLYPILLDNSLVCAKETIINKLLEKNIGTQVHYKPIYNFSHYAFLQNKILENAQNFYQAELSIPCHQNMDLNIAKIIATTVLKTIEDIAKGIK